VNTSTLTGGLAEVEQGLEVAAGELCQEGGVTHDGGYEVSLLGP
jgi:hypothetical protein